MNIKNQGKELLYYFSDNIAHALEDGKVLENEEISEIRLRLNRPVMIRGMGVNYYLGYNGNLYHNASDAVICSCEEMEYSFMKICDDSVYSFENEIREGFITVNGGHRVGICGTAVLSGKSVKTVKDINSLNFRIARQVNGCAESIANRIFSEGMSGVLVSGPPAGGKTTILRDLCRILSEKYVVSVIDERCEIAASDCGYIQNDIGPMSDVFSGYPKEKGIETALRTMSPDIILCDEIGNEGDIKAITKALNSGIKIIASVHAADSSELIKKKKIMKLIKKDAFRYVVYVNVCENRFLVQKTDELFIMGKGSRV